VSQPLEEPIQFGKYTLYERIGRGGMADVFKGRIQGPAGFERVFVVKRILPHLSDDPAFIRMFVDEAKMSARLNHPNVVQIFELGAVEQEYFISMEYVSGHDLSETMRAIWKKSGRPRPEMVAYIGREICRALSYAHGLTDERGEPLGMIHRDVSPSNVMLSYEGAVKLLDFGIAKALGDGPDEVTKSGTLKGKYAYMAPEQTDGDDVDHRIDIFAAGIVLYEVLTGRRLFKGANDVQTIERVRRCEVRPPSLINDACPPELDAILLKALARDRDDRYQDASEMADELDEIVHAAHFTPAQMSAILRDTFGPDISTTGSFMAERRSSSSSIAAASVSPVGSAARSGTVPPVALPRPRPTGQFAPLDAVDSAASVALSSRPLWKRGSFWAITMVVCAAAVGVGIMKGIAPGRSADGDGPAGGYDPSALVAAGPPPGPVVRKVKLMPVLVQSEPEGAEIYVSGKLESVGTTPKWVNLEMDRLNPARVMFRKTGYQDKAIAIETDRPPVAQLIPTNAEGRTGPDLAASETTESAHRHAAAKKKKASEEEP
jgi:serine/threonine protein kinase